MGCALCKEEEIDFDGEVDLRHFELLRSVGKGSFGKVRIVQKKNDKKMYALKYINKEKCIKMRATENIIQERRLLGDLSHPFIVNLRYAFQDDENMFMVLDLMLGGDLRYHLDRLNHFPEDVIRFYVAETALGLEYLHKHRIVHRDLKPDNLLLDERGHIHLTDFNIAVRLKPDKLCKSVAGTRAYMAPEVLNKEGYTTSPDWWSLGVIMYECLFGKRPFRGKTNEDLSNAIMVDDLKIPSNHEGISEACLSCLKGLLERDVKQRLGCGEGGMKRFKDHPFFAGIDWDRLLAKELPSPFVPDTQKANFDATYELEEMLLEDNPLKAKPRKVGKNLAELPHGKELQMMEEKFKPLNWERPNRGEPCAPSSKQSAGEASTSAVAPASSNASSGANASSTASAAGAGVESAGAGNTAVAPAPLGAESSTSSSPQHEHDGVIHNVTDIESYSNGKEDEKMISS